MCDPHYSAPELHVPLEGGRAETLRVQEVQDAPVLLVPAKLKRRDNESFDGFLCQLWVIIPGIFIPIYLLNGWNWALLSGPVQQEPAALNDVARVDQPPRHTRHLLISVFNIFEIFSTF